MTIPYALMIATLASILVFPFLDVREYISDRVMCKELGWDYEIDFVSKFSPDQLEKLRELSKSNRRKLFSLSNTRTTRELYRPTDQKVDKPKRLGKHKSVNP